MAWLRDPRVIYEVVDGQAVLVDPGGVEIVTLNPVGTLVWEELDGQRGPTELASALIGRFEGVTQSELEGDIAAFLADVEAAGLVCWSDDAET